MRTGCVRFFLLTCSVITLPAFFPGSGMAADVGALTNVAHLRLLSSLDANRGSPFTLTGIVTMADVERNIFVLQDATGAIAIQPDNPPPVGPGQLVSLSALAGAPCLPSFPQYPFKPDGSDVLTTCEIPANTGNFHLTRLGGWLNPPESGEYTFYIASDNSSELWLSTDADPSKVRKIASVQSGLWVNPREWTRYLSQRSEPVRLKAGVRYYFEAFSEQQELAEHLAVAWQGPSIRQSVIDGRFVTPWTNGTSHLRTNGILREYWTNFGLGTLNSITGERRGESIINARGITITVLDTNQWPNPKLLSLKDPLKPEDNYRWIRSRGTLDFMSVEGKEATLQIRAGATRTRVKVRNWNEESIPNDDHLDVEVEGVCEGARTTGGLILPGLIRTDSQKLRLIPSEKNHVAPAAYAAQPAATNTGVAGLFLARGVVTFNGRAFGQDIFAVQDANGGTFIVPSDRIWPGANCHVGDWVEIGGNLLRSTHSPRLQPSLVNVLGAHILPEPALPWTDPPPNGLRDGLWTELRGVIRATNSDGSLTFRSNDRTFDLWICNAGATLQEVLLDAAARLRGVIALDTESGRPRLLVPSGEFVEILDKPQPPSTFQLVTNLAAHMNSEFAHRVKIAGVVTYKDQNAFFVQDGSAGIRVQPGAESRFEIGDNLEVIGFPQLENGSPTLADSIVRSVAKTRTIEPLALESGDAIATLPNQSLVQVTATLLSHGSAENNQIFEVQLGQRILRAFLNTVSNSLPQLRPGCVLRLTGICTMENQDSPGLSSGPRWAGSLGSIGILLRDEADLAVVRGPPWWNLRKFVLLVAVLTVLLVGTIMRGQLLRRRFGRQQAARLAFAQRLIANQESERRRIAANLHDSLGQNLLAIKNQAHLALQTTPENVAVNRRLENISASALHAIEEVRQITHGLRPYQLDRLGLRQALIALVRQISETTSIQLACNIDAIDGLFPGDGEINIYRIVQEAVANVIKHSQATEATVVVRLSDNLLVISIRDNGCGRQPDMQLDLDAHTGFGLSGIAERAQIMGGNLEIETAQEKGFSVKVSVPLPATPPSTGQDEEMTHESKTAHR